MLYLFFPLLFSFSLLADDFYILSTPLEAPPEFNLKERSLLELSSEKSITLPSRENKNLILHGLPSKLTEVSLAGIPIIDNSSPSGTVDLSLFTLLPLESYTLSGNEIGLQLANGGSLHSRLQSNKEVYLRGNGELIGPSSNVKLGAALLTGEHRSLGADEATSTLEKDGYDKKAIWLRATNALSDSTVVDTTFMQFFSKEDLDGYKQDDTNSEKKEDATLFQTKLLIEMENQTILTPHFSLNQIKKKFDDDVGGANLTPFHAKYQSRTSNLGLSYNKVLYYFDVTTDLSYQKREALIEGKEYQKEEANLLLKMERDLGKFSLSTVGTVSSLGNDSTNTLLQKFSYLYLPDHRVTTVAKYFEKSPTFYEKFSVYSDPELKNERIFLLETSFENDRGFLRDKLSLVTTTESSPIEYNQSRSKYETIEKRTTNELSVSLYTKHKTVSAQLSSSYFDSNVRTVPKYKNKIEIANQFNSHYQALWQTLFISSNDQKNSFSESDLRLTYNQNLKVRYTGFIKNIFGTQKNVLTGELSEGRVFGVEAYAQF